eukprot:gene7190-9808_t
MTSPSNNDTASIKRTAKAHDLFFLGITIVIGGQIFSWNFGLVSGFWTFFTAWAIMGSGYLCLCLCIAEMMSSLPFAGGAYGFVRLMMSPFVGYMIGCCESIEYIFYVVSSVYPLGQLITLIFDGPTEYEPLYWFLFFAISLAVQITGGNLFWKFNSVLAIVSITIMVFYTFATISHCDFDKNITKNQTIHDSTDSPTIIKEFMYCLPLCAWFFVGIESVSLSGDHAIDAAINLPKGIVWCIITLLCFSLLMLFVITSQSPGLTGVSSEFLPLNPGLMNTFHISHQLAAVFSFPSLFATCFGFMFSYGQQISSMGRSGLFPSIVGRAYGDNKTPFAALITGSVISFAILCALFFSDNQDLFPHLFSICIIGSFAVYISLCVCYILFKFKFSSLQRKFVSPFGIYGAIYGIVVFAISFVAASFFQKDDYLSICAFAIIIALVVLYYLLVARKTQYFSDEEKSVMLIGYVIKSNTRSKTGLKKGNQKKSSGQSSTSKRISSNILVSIMSVASSKMPSLFGKIDERDDEEGKSSAPISKYSQPSAAINNISEKDHESVISKISTISHGKDEVQLFTTSLDETVMENSVPKPSVLPIVKIDENSNSHRSNNGSNTQRGSRRNSIFKDLLTNPIANTVTEMTKGVAKLVPGLHSMGDEEFVAYTDKLVLEKVTNENDLDVESLEQTYNAHDHHSDDEDHYNQIISNNSRDDDARVVNMQQRSLIVQRTHSRDRK